MSIESLVHAPQGAGIWPILLWVGLFGGILASGLPVMRHRRARQRAWLSDPAALLKPPPSAPLACGIGLVLLMIAGAATIVLPAPIPGLVAAIAAFAVAQQLRIGAVGLIGGLLIIASGLGLGRMLFFTDVGPVWVGVFVGSLLCAGVGLWWAVGHRGASEWSPAARVAPYAWGATAVGFVLTAVLLVAT